MPDLNWEKAKSALDGFGGVSTTLRIDKTGLPFYDALRLYGAIDLYIGLREDVSIHDDGDHWSVVGRVRTQGFKRRDIYALKAVKKMRRPEEFCDNLRGALYSGVKLARSKNPEVPAPTDYRSRTLDPALQIGIRGLAAADYKSMNSTETAWKARIPLSDAVIAYAGLKRTEAIGDMQFLPIFEGRLDLSKVVSPLRASLSLPNPLCAQVLMLLSLKAALWSEGYASRLSAIAYKKSKSRDFNYSGLLEIRSTGIDRIDGDFCSHLLRIFRQMVVRSWKNDKGEKTLRQHTIAVAEWLFQASPQKLTGMVTAQEILINSGEVPMLISTENVRKVFELTYQGSSIDHESLRALAVSVSKAIRKLGPQDRDKEKERRQHWYNQVVAIRNSPTMEALRHRVLTLLEQGRSEGSWIEPFDPVPLLESMGEDRPDFERFRDCFRMYLILASAPKRKAAQVDSDDTEETDDTECTEEGDE